VIVATSAPVAATVTPMATVLPAVTATTIPPQPRRLSQRRPQLPPQPRRLSRRRPRPPLSRRPPRLPHRPHRVHTPCSPVTHCSRSRRSSTPR
jgi:hypothetical protein